MKRMQRTGNQAARCRFYSSKQGFTLVEMLVVISIIGVLAGLVTVAAMAANKAAKRHLISQDLQQLNAGVSEFRNKYGAYPPDGTVYPNSSLFPDYDVNPKNGIPDDFERFFQRAFPRANLYSELDILKTRYGITSGDYSVFFLDANNKNVPLYTPQTAMVFWLGGMPEDYRNAKSSLIGFSKNPVNPLTDTASTSRISFFEFKTDYLRNPPNATTAPYLFRAYVPPVKTATEAPYVYFRAEPGQRGSEYYLPPGASATNPRMKAVRDLTTAAVPIIRPYYDTRSNAFLNRNSCQILSAGLDGQFFTNNPAVPSANPDCRFLAYPTGVASGTTPVAVLPYDNANQDDQANFISGTIGDEK